MADFTLKVDVKKFCAPVSTKSAGFLITKFCS